MQSIDVRPLDEAGAGDWLCLGPPVHDGDESAAAVDALSRGDTRCALLAYEGTTCVGRLRGRFLNDELYFVREVRVADNADFASVATAFAMYLLRCFAKDRTEILAWDRQDTRAMNAALEAAGFVVGREKVFVERDISGYASPYEDPCEYRSLVEVGEERFIEIMSEAATGDPFENPEERDPRRDFRSLMDYAGDRFDPTWWKVAFLGARPVGVILPQAFPGSETDGSLFYVGVVPDHRGRGLGRMLHATGLESLARKGITRYVGSTDSRNLPMLAIFAANGCAQSGTQLFYKPLRRGDGA